LAVEEPALGELTFGDLPLEVGVQSPESDSTEFIGMDEVGAEGPKRKIHGAKCNTTGCNMQHAGLQTITHRACRDRILTSASILVPIAEVGWQFSFQEW
jgi:hypothetical protein